MRVYLNKYNYLLSFFLGAFLVLSFSPFELYFLPVICYALLGYFVIKCDSIYKCLKINFLFSFAFFIFGVSWIFVSLYKYGNINFFLSSLITVLFCLYLSLFQVIGVSIYFIIDKSKKQFFFLFPCIITIFEIIRGYLFTGFPWLTLGYSQKPESPMSGYAPILGVYGITFIVLILSSSILFFFLKKKIKYMIYFFLIISLGLILKNINWTTKKENSETSFSVLQGNIPQELKWINHHLMNSVNKYLDLMSEVDSDIILMPETAIPFSSNYFHDHLESKFVNGLKQKNSTIILGIPEITNENIFYNSVVVIREENKQTYRKIHLVPFGDFFPNLKIFNWITKLLNMPMSSFTAGEKEQKPIIIKNLIIAPNICYEDVFGNEIVTNFPSANILINFTNDAWWGDSLAPKQHLQIAQMRSMETGKMQIRATNNGVSALINSNGEVVKKLEQFKTDILRGVVYGYEGKTPYYLYNDKLIISICLLLIFLSFFNRKWIIKT